MCAWTAVLAMLAAAAVLAVPASAATPAGAALTPDAAGNGAISWTGSVGIGGETLKSDNGVGCFGPDNRPAAASGCDVFALDVAVTDAFYKERIGSVAVNVGGFGITDLDLYVYRRNADGTRGEFVAGDGQFLGTEENVSLDKAAGAYFAVVTPYTTVGPQSYTASARLVTGAVPDRAKAEAAAPKGLPNFRASRDKFTSHSEPTIAMDPLDHDHLMAGSKMYENNAKYLFKIGTYESHDGGRTWEDQGQLPGYCQKPGECDPQNEAAYRTVSDISLDFDDEGNAYASVLDAPGGTAAFQGFNLTVHVKRPGQPWSGPTTVHNNRFSDLTTRLLLDDKNWIAVDNHTDVNGAANKPRDGKVGTMYICWDLDGNIPVANFQEIAIMRSVDGGKTWGGLVPGDNIPLPISQKTYVSGIGCHIAIGPKGEVYATWYDNQLNALMQAKSTNRGRLWTPAAPIAGITGVNTAFAGETFRNLSLPTTAVDSNGTVYVAASSRDGQGKPLLGNILALGKQIESGKISPDALEQLVRAGGEEDAGAEIKAGGDGLGPESGSDIVLFKSTNGGRSYTGPVRVNQDPPNGDGDQFQPWMAVTPSGQIDISFFDRRDDPSNYFIDTWLARSEDGGRTFTDRRVSQRMWDPAINAPTSVSGQFIGDYQGLVADDDAAIPFWNDTQLANLPPTDKEYSPYQEVFAARVANGAETPAASTRCFPRRLNVGAHSIGKISVRATRDLVGRRAGPPARTARGVLRYCVKGGGSVLVSFDAKSRVNLVATTAKAHRRLSIGRGATLAALRRRFGSRLRSSPVAGVRRVGAGSSKQLLFGVRRNRVTFVAVAGTTLLRDRSALRTQLRRAALVRGR